MRSFAASGVRFAFCFVMVSGMAALTGCGGGGGSDATAAATTPPVSNPSTAPSNQAPTISGSPTTAATAGKAYSFTPTAHDADASDKVTFTIANKPGWAAFDAATGALTGTPAATDIGASQPIEIAATDGVAVTSLPTFTITVAAGSTTSKSVSLAWTPPTQNSDGSSLVDLKGYKIHYGAESQNYTSSVSVDNPGLTRFVIDSLPAGKVYIAMTAYNASGAESPFSQEVTVTLN
jgi:Putative Ig domain